MALAQAELATVRKQPGSSGWEVEAGTKVGAVSIGDLQVVIRPKVPIARLMFLLGYARAPAFWRDSYVHLDPEKDIVEALAESFARTTTKALEQGLPHGYLSVDESLPVMRGRLRVGDQLTRRLGTGLPLEVTFDDFTADIAENRILLKAVLCLLRNYAVDGGTRRTLNRLRLQLADVTAEPRGLPLPRWTPSRLNRRLQPALHLAELILAGSSFEQRVGTLQVHGFVVDMWKVFEDFVCVALGESVRGVHGRPSFQHRAHLDVDRRVRLRPDFVWLREGRPVAVVDAKYKAEKPSGFPHADLYQLLAYCTVMQLPEGHLIYAKGSEEPTSHVVMSVQTKIVCHAIDLEATPAELLREMEQISMLMAN